MTTAILLHHSLGRHPRKLIAARYHLEMVIISHDSERPNFSENTDLSEVLFIARKRGKRVPADTTYVSLWRNPRSIHEALDYASRIAHQDKPPSVEGAGISSFRSSGRKLGEIFTTPAPNNEENWTGALFAQAELARTFWQLKRGKIHVPGNAEAADIPLCQLESLGELGYDRRDIHDAFEISYDDLSPYPAFWGHEAAKVSSIAQNAGAHLIARTSPAAGRKLKSATSVWAKAGNILLVERLRSNTHKVLAIGFEKPVLGNTWWSFKDRNLTDSQRKALLLWLNSSLALLNFFGRRVITEGAWMQMKKPAWSTMPVLDVRSLGAEVLADLDAAYDRISALSLSAIARLDVDLVRKEIDDVLCGSLKLPDLQLVRQFLAREPGLSALGINAARH